MVDISIRRQGGDLFAFSPSLQYESETKSYRLTNSESSFALAALFATARDGFFPYFAVRVGQLFCVRQDFSAENNL